MFFGLPWFAIVAIVAIGGGLIYAYKEQELKFEEKRLNSSREVNELRQIVHNLKSRVENLEAIVAEDESTKSSEADPLESIQIDDEIDDQIDDNSTTSTKSKAQS